MRGSKCQATVSPIAYCFRVGTSKGEKIVRTTPTKQNSGTFKGSFSNVPTNTPSLSYESSGTIHPPPPRLQTGADTPVNWRRDCRVWTARSWKIFDASRIPWTKKGWSLLPEPMTRNTQQIGKRPKGKNPRVQNNTTKFVF